MSKKYFHLRTISICFVERRAGRDHVFTTWASASGPPTFPAKSQESFSELQCYPYNLLPRDESVVHLTESACLLAKGLGLMKLSFIWKTKGENYGNPLPGNTM
jgi:hypothetical protein